MCRKAFILISFLLVTVALSAQSDLPVVEIRADRTVIYPQRMLLTGEESLMDLLQMVPELLTAGYEDVIAGYNLRIDNAPMNGDTRLILSQMKAKDISRIHVCDNTGVAKGTIGMGRVLDINMKMPEAAKGFVEGQGSMGKDFEGIGTANVLYGSRSIDLYANTSHRFHDGYEEYLTLHGTNRFGDRDKLLTYFTQQYLDRPAGTSRKVMGRARYFHTFNDLGTELLLVGGYQYASDAAVSNKVPLVLAELNTPLFTDRLSMMLGFEGDYLMASQKPADRSWHAFNNDLYLQFAYSLAKWKFAIGQRTMLYDYQVEEGDITRRRSDMRSNANACAVYAPNSRHQMLLGYYRKFYNPAYEALFKNVATLSDDDWAVTKGRLDERTINQLKLGYAYSRQKLTVEARASYYVVEQDENFAETGASACWTSKGLRLAGGSNFYISERGGYASFRLAPTLCLPHQWQACRWFAIPAVRPSARRRVSPCMAV